MQATERAHQSDQIRHARRRWCWTSLSQWLHRWLGLVLTVQLVFWLGGGLLMASLPLDKVHGDHLVKHRKLPSMAMDAYQISLDELLLGVKEQGRQVNRVELTSRLQRPVYLIHAHGKTLTFDAGNGEPLPPMSKSQIEGVASALYTGDDAIAESILLSQLPMEAGSAEGQFWRINFDDGIRTSFYFDAHTGQLLKVRSDLWRLFDIAWMLHIMDYDTRDDFNNPLLITFAIGALIFALSGVVLLYRWIRLSFIRQRRLSPAA